MYETGLLQRGNFSTISNKSKATKLCQQIYKHVIVFVTIDHIV